MVLGDVFLRIACPRCRGGLGMLPVEAKFCPDCGLRLPDFCPDPHFDPGVAQPDLIFWHLLELQKVRRPRDGNPLTLRAYTNALFNLGFHYEEANGPDRNLPQALRYFQKAARLGSHEAQRHIKHLNVQA